MSQNLIINYGRKRDKAYPLIIDEAKNSQNIFRTIKLIVDKKYEFENMMVMPVSYI